MSQWRGSAVKVVVRSTPAAKVVARSMGVKAVVHSIPVAEVVASTPVATVASRSAVEQRAMGQLAADDFVQMGLTRQLLQFVAAGLLMVWI